ncbi:UDP-D-xylose:L-fucose alpha-1,3-D-xylosyltransferase mgp4 [Dionaea muscipula]
MSSFLHQRQTYSALTDPYPLSPRISVNYQRSSFLFNRTNLLILISLLILLGFFHPYLRGFSGSLFSSNAHLSESPSQWRDYTLKEAVSFVGRNGSVVIVAAVSEPYLPFLNNWLISIVRQKHQDKVLVIAEDYATLHKVNERWPGHAVLIPPAPDSQSAHKFGSQGFFNFTSRRPRHLLQILELGYTVMYNDVDMVWLADPFPYLQGNHDVYFTDDMAVVKPLNHPHDLPPPGKKGRTYICSCMIFLHPTAGAKLVMNKWIEELAAQPWSKAKKSNDQPAFNWALNRTAGQVSCSAFTCLVSIYLTILSLFLSFFLSTFITSQVFAPAMLTCFD